MKNPNNPIRIQRIDQALEQTNNLFQEVINNLTENETDYYKKILDHLKNSSDEKKVFSEGNSALTEKINLIANFKFLFDKTKSRKAYQRENPVSSETKYFTSENCLKIYTNNGEKIITQNQYKTFIKNISQYDLFINGITGELYKKYSSPHFISLNRSELDVLSLYIQHPNQFIDSYQVKRILKRMNSSSIQEYFKRARKKIDIKDGRYSFMLFKKRNSSYKNLLYSFTPPTNFKYCLIF